jgi:hypothetical protein
MSTCKLLPVSVLVQINVAVLLKSLLVRVESKNALILLPVATAIVNALLGLLLHVPVVPPVRMVPVSFPVRVAATLAHPALLLVNTQPLVSVPVLTQFVVKTHRLTVKVAVTLAHPVVLLAN